MRWPARAAAAWRSLSSQADPAPTELTLLKGAKALRVAFAGGETYHLPAELLRAYSPAANSASPSLAHAGSKVVAGRRHVGIMRLEPVGNYAVSLHFDDLHRTGLFTWPLLRSLGAHKTRHMRQYLAALKAQGLSRDPRRSTRPGPW